VAFLGFLVCPEDGVGRALGVVGWGGAADRKQGGGEGFVAVGHY
jgi:hypothetical protein